MDIPFDSATAVDLAPGSGPLALESFIVSPIPIEESPFLPRASSKLFSVSELRVMAHSLAQRLLALPGTLARSETFLSTGANSPVNLDVARSMIKADESNPTEVVAGDIEGGVKFSLHAGTESRGGKRYGESVIINTVTISKRYMTNDLMQLGFEHVLPVESNEDDSKGAEALDEYASQDLAHHFEMLAQRALGSFFSAKSSSGSEGKSDTNPLISYLTVSLDLGELDSRYPTERFTILSERQFLDESRNAGGITTEALKYRYSLNTGELEISQTVSNRPESGIRTYETLRDVDEQIINHFLLELLQWGEKTAHELEARPWKSTTAPTALREPSPSESYPQSKVSIPCGEEFFDLLLGISMARTFGGRLPPEGDAIIQLIQSNPEAGEEFKRCVRSLAARRDPFPDEQLNDSALESGFSIVDRLNEGEMLIEFILGPDSYSKS